MVLIKTEEVTDYSASLLAPVVLSVDVNVVRYT